MPLRHRGALDDIRLMLTGPALGAAIDAARQKKKGSQNELKIDSWCANSFGCKPDNVDALATIKAYITRPE